MKAKKPYNLKLGLELKQQGMGLAADNRLAALLEARTVARRIALRRPERLLTIDAVRAVLPDLGMAAGSVFKTPDWQWTGGYKITERASSHARPVKIWRFIGKWLKEPS